MPETYDDRGEPIGTMPVADQAPPDAPMQGPPAPPPVAIPQQSVPSGAPFISPSFAGRTDVMPDRLGGMVVPQGAPTVGLTPDSQAEMSGFLENAAKAGRLDQAQKDVDQAMRFLGMRGVEKDVQGGMSYPQALAKHLPYISWNNPAQAAAYSRIIQQSQPLSMTNMEGVKILRTPHGDRIVPQSAIPHPPVTSAQSIPFTDPSGQVVPGHFAVPSPTGRGFTVHKQADLEPRLTPTEERHRLNDAIKFKGAQIDRLANEKPPVKDEAGTAVWKQKRDKLNSEMDQLEAQRPNLLQQDKGKYLHLPDRKVGDVKQMPGSDKHPAGLYKWMGDAKGWIRQE